MDIDSIYRLYFRDVFLFLQGMTHNEALASASLWVMPCRNRNTSRK